MARDRKTVSEELDQAYLSIEQAQLDLVVAARNMTSAEDTVDFLEEELAELDD